MSVRYVFNPFTARFDAVLTPVGQGWQWGVLLSGAKDGLNNIYTTPETFDPRLFAFYVNGQRQVQWEDYVVSESAGAGTGYDTVTMLGSVLPLAGDQLTSDYVASGPVVSIGYLSHWNTADGSNGDQTVGESISRTAARISTPAGGEGIPFKTGGWAGADHAGTLSAVVTFTTPGETTGFGAGSSMAVTIYDADGITAIESYVTPGLGTNGLHVSPSGNISVTITAYGADGTRFKANASVSVDIGAILSGFGRSGGRYHVRIIHTTDPATDGTGPFSYTQTDVFLDTNPSTPSINGTVVVAEVGGSIVTKHLSGLEYYTTGSQFDVSVTDIDNLNENTSKPSGNLILVGTSYGLAQLTHSPFGVGSSYFTGWTNSHNVQDVSYQKPDWAISAGSYRYSGSTANVAGTPADPWASGVPVLSTSASVLVDTFGVTSTNTVQTFDDESKRLENDFTTSWDSTDTLAAGEAMVFGGYLQVPNTTSPTSNWSAYKPDLGGANPDYSALGAPAEYHQAVPNDPGNITSFQIVFSGVFANGNALADLINGDLEVYVYRIGGLGHIGKPPPGGSNIWPLRVHVLFNLADWDDGVSVLGSGIREGSSSGNSINCTLGPGTPANGGLYVTLKIVNPVVNLDGFSVTFF
jgi:hypothetical protein